MINLKSYMVQKKINYRGISWNNRYYYLVCIDEFYIFSYNSNVLTKRRIKHKTTIRSPLIQIEEKTLFALFGWALEESNQIKIASNFDLGLQHTLICVLLRCSTIVYYSTVNSRDFPVFSRSDFAHMFSQLVQFSHNSCETICCSI